MPWRNSLLSCVVGFPLLACLGFVGQAGFYALPEASRPGWLWYGSFLLGVFAPVGAFFFGRRLRQRLDGLCAFIAVAPERLVPPSLPVWEADELGRVEDGLHRFLQRQYDHIHDLRGAQQNLEAVLMSMAEGVIVLDLAGNIVLSNTAAHQLFGLPPDAEWQGKSLFDFSRHPGLHDLVRNVAKQASGAEAMTREIEIGGETPHSVAVSARQICKNGTLVSGTILALHDLTQMKRLESIRADFVANVSHELRTPLTAIKGYAETLLNGALNDPPVATRFLQIIDRHSERLGRLIEDLLTLSDLELGKTELRNERIVLPHLVDEVFELVKEKATNGGVTLSQSLPQALPVLKGDGDRLHQVLLNLVDNAVKYTPAGGSVVVSAQTLQRLPDHASGEALDNGQSHDNHGWLEVAVADTGCGIPQVDIPRLTQRFYRVDKARSRELGGTGLGLAIVKHIVQAHGGFLHVESQLERGTTMRIFLPLPLDEQPSPELSTESSVA